MPEFNRNFAQGKMNKDLDERLVPAGQYRHAQNIEVSTSEGSNVGALETIPGNVAVTQGSVPPDSFTVGAIVNNEENCVYHLVAGATETNATDNRFSPRSYAEKDYIIKYNVDSGLYTYVFVDIYKASVTVESITNVGGTSFITVENSDPIRPGMVISGDRKVTRVIGSDVFFGEEDDLSNLPVGENVVFSIDRVLNFQEALLITGINIVDNFIMFTDNDSEPKIVNIERSIVGTGRNDLVIGNGDNRRFHTRLVIDKVDGDFGLHVAKSIYDAIPVYSELENNTTIKKSPLTPPTLKMSSTTQERDGEVSTTISTNQFVDSEGNPIATQSTLTLTFDDNVDFELGDYILFSQNLDQDELNFTDHDVRVRVTEVLGPNQYEVQVQAISSDLTTDESFLVLLQQVDPLFEFKFPRFSYRYKYQDGQYSAFAPFSEVAFLPSNFDYYPKEGYNQGMVNNLRNLKVQNYAPQWDNRAKDIVEIDVLYKEEGSTTVYTVKTIKPSDGSPLWPSEDDYNTSTGRRGEISIESEMIHAIVPSNQLLRPWDNVPRKALAQEVSANRLIYANYVQNYDLVADNNTVVTPKINLSLITNAYQADEIEVPKRSIKSMRTYQLGVLYRDEFGRETPVLADKKKGSLIVGKEFCNHFNSFRAKIESAPPAWAKSFKFFVKETSNEYYNLAMDRWYNAEDGNLWLSFPSSDRNKVDIETFLELKKAHNTTEAVTQPARYKILAIENEAPLDIKLDRKSQGVLLNSSYTDPEGTTVTNGLLGSTAEGYPAEGYNFIIVEREEFEEVFDQDFVISKASECSLKIRRITGDRSEWYEINSIALDNFNGGNDNCYKITIAETFGPDVNFASTAGTFATRVAGVQVEITHDEYEDKPEFDGKFFVKVFKDQIAEDFLMRLDAEENLVVVDAAEINYINSYRVNDDNVTAYPGNADEYRITNNNNFGFSLNFNNPYKNTLGQEATVNPYNTSYTWGDSGSYTGPNTPKDLNNYNEGTDFWEDYYTNNGKAKIFIDDAWAAQWCFTRHEVHPNVPGDGENDDKALTLHSAPFFDPSIGEPNLAGAELEGSDWNLGTGVFQNGSKGIRGSLIDISVTGGMHGEVDNGDQWFTPAGMRFLNPIQLAESGGIVPGDAGAFNFMSLLSIPETKWRFREDPDKTIYKNVNVYEHYGIINYDKKVGNSDRKFYRSSNKRNKFTLQVDKNIDWDPRTVLNHDGSNSVVIEIMGRYQTEDAGFSSENPAIFETYPKEDIGLDIYYEISRAYPIVIDESNYETLALLGGTLQEVDIIGYRFDTDDLLSFEIELLEPIDTVAIEPLTLVDGYGGSIQVVTSQAHVNSTRISVYKRVHNNTIDIPWFNCFAFGNGVESDRIRDDFNAPTIQNGVKASTTLAEQYKEERRGEGFIFSGIYNSNSGVNRLNQFIQAEPITKDLNPDNGSIQKLFARQTDIITLCEDKVLKVLSNKDALYNADGNSNVTATARVLGAETPFVGEYGISKNPESFAADEYRCYFTDVQRGAVLRLSRDGVTPISGIGMKDYFSDTFYDVPEPRIIGSFDDRKSDYNISIYKGFNVSYDKAKYVQPVTVTFNEDAKGWTSFKTFYQENGVSINNQYYTFFDGVMWHHHVNPLTNNFYGQAPTSNEHSYVEIIFNDVPSSVKNFQTIKYEGTQAKVNKFSNVIVDGVSYTDKEYYNLNEKKGWFVEYANTDLQEGKVPEFINKEGKWFNNIFGACTNLQNLDEREFTTQGIGIATFTHSDPDSVAPVPVRLTIKEDNEDIDGTNWD